MILKCKCGTVSPEFQKTSNIVDMAKLSSFGFVWDISSGLSAIWMCSNCRDEVVVFGGQLRMRSFKLTFKG